MVLCEVFQLQKSRECFGELFEARYDSVRDKFIEEANADNYGLRIAYFESFNTSFLKRHMLPFTKDMNIDTKRLWLVMRAYAQCHASTDSKWGAEEGYPPGFRRVNRGLKNFYPFWLAFDCNRRDPMRLPHLNDTCNLLPLLGMEGFEFTD